MDNRAFLFAFLYVAQLIYVGKGFSCDVSVERVGCFHDTSRPLDKLLVYRRETYNYEEQKVALPSLLCDCALKAQAGNHSYIGLQYYAECWTSSESHPHYDRDGGAGKGQCVNAEFKPCSHNDTVCVGRARANFIYKIVDSSKMTSPTPTEGTVLTTEATESSSPPTTPGGIVLTTKSSESPPSSPTTKKKVVTTASEITPPSSSTSQLTTERPPTPSTVIPSTVVPVTTTQVPATTTQVPATTTQVPATTTQVPCEDKETNCADLKDYCSGKYTFMLKQCPKTCQVCP